MNRVVILVFLLLVSITTQAREIDGVAIPETLSIEGNKTPLVLNGAGLRTRYTAKIYVAGLYLTQPGAAAEAVLESSAPRAVALHLRRDSDSEQIASALIGSVGKNHSLDEMKRLRDRLNQFQLMLPDIKKGQIVFLEFPANGETRVRLNNELRGVLQGADFQRALLRIWLGAKPVDNDLKHQLLGARP